MPEPTNPTPPAMPAPSTPLPGCATAEGTAAYAARFPAAAAGHFGVTQGLTLASIGIGTYLGEASDDFDARYRETVALAVTHGTNVIDTAINYRFQRSERSIAPALRDAVAAGLRREELLVCSKAGFIPFDATYPTNPTAWINENIIDPGLATTDELVGGMHCLSPAFIRNQLAQSRANLGLDCIDVYYLHNPEAQVETGVARPEFLRRMRDAFEVLEAAAAAGEIGAYGAATWSGFRCAPSDPAYLSVEELASLAREVGGNGHHFRFLQAPFNLLMPEVAVVPTQKLGGQMVTLLHAALELGLTVVGSAALMQARLISKLPRAMDKALPGLKNDAARALQFARSAPGLTCALVGMASTNHVRQNMELLIRPPLTTEEFADVFRTTPQPRRETDE